MKTKNYLNIAWIDQNWEIDIRNPNTGGCRLDREALRLVRSRFEPLPLPPDMYRPVSLKSSRPQPDGFTLVELLVVIGIIAILAGIFLPVLAGVKTRAKVANTRSEMAGLAAAIRAYESDYNRYPASQLSERASVTPNPVDFTFGTFNVTLPDPSAPAVINGPPITHETNNSEVVLLLLDVDQGINLNHVRNPRKNKYWNAKMVTGPVGGVSTEDFIARDPWGNPYIITVDMNDDNKCVDAFYRLNSVSSKSGNVGHYGLSMPPGVTGNNFELHQPVMIWSAGPNRTYDTGTANAGLNRDNILSWSN
jgi:prepilin-type N-terminal cleavage/methylation domain-containing protein